VCLEEKLMRLAILFAMILVAFSSNPLIHKDLYAQNTQAGKPAGLSLGTLSVGSPSGADASGSSIHQKGSRKSTPKSGRTPERSKSPRFRSPDEPQIGGE
jgi:hypothetical protein